LLPKTSVRRIALAESIGRNVICYALLALLDEVTHEEELLRDYVLGIGYQ
jgi:hypothetical protein